MFGRSTAAPERSSDGGAKNAVVAPQAAMAGGPASPKGSWGLKVVGCLKDSAHKRK